MSQLFRACRFRGVTYLSRDWHTDAFHLMLRDVEPNPKARLEIWLPLLEQGVEEVVFGYVRDGKWQERTWTLIDPEPRYERIKEKV